MFPENIQPKEKEIIFQIAALEWLDKLGIVFPGKPSKEYITQIAFQDGKSLGRCVAEAIIAEAEQLKGQIVNRVDQDLSEASALNMYLILSAYSWPAQKFLVAEEEIRTGEPPKDTDIQDDDRKFGDILRRSSSALEFLDKLPQLPQSPNKNDEARQFISVLLKMVNEMGEDRFRKLYNVAMRARGKALGMTKEEIHREFINSLKSGL